MSSDLLNTIGAALQTVVAVFGALLVAFWIALIIWTFRDMRARTRDILAALLATLLVLLFGPIGLGLYLLLRPRDTLAEQYERMLEEEALLRDMEEQPVCSSCQHKIQPDWMLCPHCTAELRRPWPNPARHTRGRRRALGQANHPDRPGACAQARGADATLRHEMNMRLKGKHHE